MSEPAPNTISITVVMDTKHDVRAVRLLLKRLLRAYDLKCVGLAGVSDEPSPIAETAGEDRQNCPPVVETPNEIPKHV